jgi:2-C-methyl-D-erythritol 4-phosphate cytidylyltransferase / 2-C-methyl-D-erythritol 2,4-cyclodiphosphate synthase
MVLGGIEIESPFGFKAHSDGDVAIHALIDALLGAACLGDIGMLFPDTDDAYKNIDSKLLLERCVQKLHHFGFVILHADITIIAQDLKLPLIKNKCDTLASLLIISRQRVSTSKRQPPNISDLSVAKKGSASLPPHQYTILIGKTDEYTHYRK